MNASTTHRIPTLSLVLLCMGLSAILAVAGPVAKSQADFVDLTAITSTETGPQGEPTLAMHPTDPDKMVVAAPQAAQSMKVWYTEDAGATWQRTLTTIDGTFDGIASTARGDPSLAFAPDGCLYLSYIVNSAGVPHYLVCAKSLDGGRTFTDPTIISSVNNTDKALMAIGPKRTEPGYVLYIAFDVDKVLKLAKMTTQGSPMSFSVADLSSLSQRASFAMPAVARNGELILVWHQSPTETFEGTIRCAVSHNEGVSFDGPQVIGEAAIRSSATGNYVAPGRGIHTGPCVAVDTTRSPYADRVYVVYTTGELAANYFIDSTDVVIQYADLGPGELAWSFPGVVHQSDGAYQFLPWMAIDPSNGRVVVLYLDSRNGNNRAVQPYVSMSLDGGETWFETMFNGMLTDNSCLDRTTHLNYLEYHGVAVAEGMIRGVWTGRPWRSYCDPTDAMQDIVFATHMCDFATASTLRVPASFTTIGEALQAAVPGDVVEVDGSAGPIVGSFKTKANVKILARPASGRPVLRTGSNECALVTVPLRAEGEFEGFDFDMTGQLTGAGVSADLVPSVTPTRLRLRDCNFISGAVTGIQAHNAIVEVDGCSLDLSGPAGIDFIGRHDGVGVDGRDSIGVVNSTIQQTSGVGLRALHGTTVRGLHLRIEGAETGLLSADCPAVLNDLVVPDATASALRVWGGSVIATDCSFAALSETDTTVAVADSRYVISGGQIGNIIARSTLTGGGIGLGATDSYLRAYENSIVDQSTKGIDILFDRDDVRIHTQLADNLIVSSSSTGTGVALLGMGGAEQVRAEVTGNTIDGWGVGLRAMSIQPEPPPPPPPSPPLESEELVQPDLFWITLQNNMITNFNVSGVDFSGISDRITPARAYPCRYNNSYSLNRPSYILTGLCTENLQLPPRYCESHESSVGEYTLRINSPGAPGNFCEERIGARDVECAWGDLLAATESRTEVTVAPGSEVLVLEDVDLRVGKTLRVKQGCVFRFDGNDESGTGSSYLKNELKIFGALIVEGASGSEVRFESASASPNEGDWYGLYVQNGASVSLDYATVRHGIYGLKCATHEASSVTRSRFLNNQTYDILVVPSTVGSCPLRIAHNTITVGGGRGSSSWHSWMALRSIRTRSSGMALATQGLRWGWGQPLRL